MANFNVTGFSSDITEGSSLSLMLTPVSALVAGVTVRWEIVLDGQLVTTGSSFPTLSGTVTFAAGARGSRTVTIPTSDDLFISENRGFSVRLIEDDGIESQVVFNREVTLTDNDTTRSFSTITLAASGEHDTLVFGSSYTYRSASGGAGDDTFIITKHQRGDLSLSDPFGSNVVKFDEGSSITAVVLAGFGRFINKMTITLGTGAEISIASPSTTFSYQLGDGVLMDYAAFLDEVVDVALVANVKTQLATPYAITDGLNAPINNAAPDKFTVTSLQDTVEEGDDLSFMLTPVSALVAGLTVRWEIVLDGQLAATSNFFPALSGMVTFEAGATDADGQTVTIATSDDLFISENRRFSVRLIEVAGDGTETQIGDDHAVTLTDNDTTRSFSTITLAASGEHDTLVFGSSYTYRSASGGAGDDTFIITKHQLGNLSLSDPFGSNVVKFDEGSSITAVVLAGFGRFINKMTITLGTGAEISIASPSTTFSYQLGDGVLMDYAAFLDEVVGVALVANVKTQLATPYAITGGLPDTGPYYARWVDAGETITMSDGTSEAFTGGAGFHRFAIGDDGVRDEGDVFVPRVLGSVNEGNLIILDDRVPDNELITSFARGNDVYLIEQGFNALNLTIGNSVNFNIIAFGDNVEVKGIDLIRFPGENRVSEAILMVDPDTSNASTVNDTVSITLLGPEKRVLFYDTNDVRPVLEDFDTFSADII